MARLNPRPIQPLLEILEGRALPAVNLISLNQVNGILTIRTDDNPTTVRVEYILTGVAPAQIEKVKVTEGGLSGIGMYLTSTVRRVEFQGGLGNDIFSAAGIRVSVQALGHFGNDWLTGGSGTNSLDGGSGADTIQATGSGSFYGGDGLDIINTGNGNDYVDGGEGNDTIITQGGNDEIDGGLGNDTILSGEGNDTVRGGQGADHITGGAGNDRLEGNDDNDTILGTTGNDTILGGEGNDILRGEADSDLINGGNGEDTLDGGVGADTLNGEANNDILRGSDGDDTLNGGDGNDTLDGGIGNDFLNCGNGNDTALGGTGNDTINGWAGEDGLSGGQGNDIINGGDNNDALNGEDGNDTLHGGVGNDVIVGMAGLDTINGDGGNDVINGGLGVDTINGGEGNDTIHGNEDADVIRGGTGLDQLFGDGGNDTIGGDNDADTISGGPGLDRLDGNNGNDTIDGGTEADTINGGPNADTIRGGGGNDSIDGGTEADFILGGLDNDILRGGDGNDTVNGNAGTDQLFGGNGDDVLVSLDDLYTDILQGDAGRDAFWSDSTGLTTNGVRQGDVRRDLGAQDVDNFVTRFDFIGMDRTLDGDRIAEPQLTGLSYQSFGNNPLFPANGPTGEDINQGGVGDCMILSAFSALAHNNTSGVAWPIRRAMVDFGDGTFGFALNFARGLTFRLRMDGDFPVDALGEIVFAKLGRENSLWVPLAEKAVVFFNFWASSQGLFNVPANTPLNYANLDFDQRFPDQIFTYFGSANTGIIFSPSLLNAQAMANDLFTRWNTYQNVVVAVDDNNFALGIPVNHAYTLWNVNRNAAGQVTTIVLRNPWGVDVGSYVPPAGFTGYADANPNDAFITLTPAQLYATTPGFSNSGTYYWWGSRIL